MQRALRTGTGAEARREGGWRTEGQPGNSHGARARGLCSDAARRLFARGHVRGGGKERGARARERTVGLSAKGAKGGRGAGVGHRHTPKPSFSQGRPLSRRPSPEVCCPCGRSHWALSSPSPPVGPIRAAVRHLPTTGPGLSRGGGRKGPRPLRGEQGRFTCPRHPHPPQPEQEHPPPSTPRPPIPPRLSPQGPNSLSGPRPSPEERRMTAEDGPGREEERASAHPGATASLGAESMARLSWVGFCPERSPGAIRLPVGRDDRVPSPSQLWTSTPRETRAGTPHPLRRVSRFGCLSRPAA